MEFFENNRKLIITVAVILCIAAAILTVDRAKPTFIENTFGFIITPVQKFTTNITDWFDNKLGYFRDLSELQVENEELQAQIQQMTAELNFLRLVEDENDKLTALLQLDSKYSNYEMMGAKIIAKDPGNWYNTFLIDKGSQDGLEKNMVVLTADGLVGRIKECGYNYSKVISIIDDTDAVSSKSLRTDDIGYIRGNLANEGMCKMEYVDNSAEIIEGDEIVTSHLSKIFPPGITIGYVKEIHTDTNALTKYAEVEPAVDFKHLDTVMVINQSFVKEYINEAPLAESTVAATTAQQ